MRRFALLPALGLALVAGLGQADPPDLRDPNAPRQPAAGLSNLMESSSAPDINAAFAITPEAGPWVICAASYQGPDAPELANKLCEYLRNRRYPAYVYNRGNEERKKLQEELNQWQKKNPTTVRKWRLAHPQEEQLAVLIGGFRDADAASSELKKIRKLELPNIKLKSGKPGCDTVDLYEQTANQKNYELKRYAVNPFHSAMAVPNPTIPRQRQTAAKVDPLWKKLNADEPRSLFKCSKHWTLAVQEYAGNQVIQPAAASSGFLEKLGFGDHDLGKRLDASALQAQQVCDLLKRFGYKSYVLHTRTNSVVTVGEFNKIDDPELVRIQQELSKFSFKDQAGHEIVKLFAKPLPMEVPH
jgi:hypothetical protein